MGGLGAPPMVADPNHPPAMVPNYLTPFVGLGTKFVGLRACGAPNFNLVVCFVMGACGPQILVGSRHMHF